MHSSKVTTESNIHELAERIQREICRYAPGLATILNVHSWKRYGVDFARLLLVSPSKAYKLLIDVYGNDRGRLLAESVVAKPLATVARPKQSYRVVLRLVEEGKDEEIHRMLGIRVQAPNSRRGRKAAGALAHEGITLGEALSCAVLIEKLFASIYRKFTVCVTGMAGTVFTYIADESVIHSKILASIAVSLGIIVDENICPIEPGGFVDRLREIDRQLARGCLEKDEFSKVLCFLASKEEILGEEDYMRVLVRELRKVVDDKTFDMLEAVLASIAHDEKNHAVMVRRVYERLYSGKPASPYGT
ncbi:MAG TPA: hypothetical protein EYP33_05580 [Pyrodictium sp.]|nr:hypothetical protein [Pyrodictium sp.]